MYSIRVNGNSFVPKVLKRGLYSIKVGDPDLDKMETKKHVKAESNNSTVINFEFN